MLATPSLVKCSFAARLLDCNKRTSCADKFACKPTKSASFKIQQYTRWSKSSPPSAVSPCVDNTSNTPLDNFKIDTSNVPPPKSYTANVPSFATLSALSKPYAIAAAVGSLSKRNTFSPAMCAASLVACRCDSSKYAGTVITAPTMSSLKLCNAR